MPKFKKATRKFKQHRLKGELAKRKVGRKIKQQREHKQRLRNAAASSPLDMERRESRKQQLLAKERCVHR